MNFPIRPYTHLLVIAGSRAYGTHTATSDIDVKGVSVPPKACYLGFGQNFQQADSPEHIATFTDLLTENEQQITRDTKLEGTVYEIRKFIELAAASNPNIWDVLFCRESEVRFLTPVGRKLRENRDLFISARAKHSFSGYSASQLKRIRGHRQWLLHPPSHEPTRADFSLPERTLIPADQLAAANAAVNKKLDTWEFDFSGVPDAEGIRLRCDYENHLTEMSAVLGFQGADDPVADMRWLGAARCVGLTDNLILILQKEREYENARRQWQQYQTWKKNRNPDRAAMEDKYGFDGKHGMHLARLLRQAKEILTTGKVHVWRGPDSDNTAAPNDAEELLAIRNGNVSYDELVGWAEKQDAELDVIYNSKQYVIPKAPDQAKINQLCIELVETALSSQ